MPQQQTILSAGIKWSVGKGFSNTTKAAIKDASVKLGDLQDDIYGGQDAGSENTYAIDGCEWFEVVKLGQDFVKVEDGR